MNKKLLKKMIKQNKQIIDLLTDISKKQNKNFAELSKRIDSIIEKPEEKDNKIIEETLDILETVKKIQKHNLKEILGRISDCSHHQEPRNQRRQHSTYYSNDSEYSED